MKKWLQNLIYRYQIMMQGRYGNDELSAFLSGCCFLLLILSCIPALKILFLIAMLLYIWSCFRMLSRNYPKRYAELLQYQKIKKSVSSEISLWQRRWHDRKQYRYYRCRKCRKILRVPTGKGKINIYCRSCGNEFRKKT